MRKIDIFNHVMPLKFFERIGDYKDIGKRMREVPMLYDLDERRRPIDRGLASPERVEVRAVQQQQLHRPSTIAAA